jgi:hypothetical protein
MLLLAFLCCCSMASVLLLHGVRAVAPFSAPKTPFLLLSPASLLLLATLVLLTSLMLASLQSTPELVELSEGMLEQQDVSNSRAVTPEWRLKPEQELQGRRLQKELQQQKG